MSRRAVIVDWPHDVCRIYPVFDVHSGSRALDEKKARKYAGIIAADPFGIVIGGGDYFEAIASSDPRFDPYELTDPITADGLASPFAAQINHFYDIFKPTVGKWKALIRGNHESTVLRHYHTDMAAVLAHRLGSNYLGGSDESGWVLIRMFQGDKLRQRVKVYIQHGWGGGSTVGSPANHLQKLMMAKDADLVLMGHHHKTITLSATVEGINNRGVEESRVVWGSVCPPLVGKHGYIARKGGNSPAIGYTVAHIHRQHDGPTVMGVEQMSL